MQLRDSSDCCYVKQSVTEEFTSVFLAPLPNCSRVAPVLCILDAALFQLFHNNVLQAVRLRGDAWQATSEGLAMENGEETFDCPAGLWKICCGMTERTVWPQDESVHDPVWLAPQTGPQHLLNVRFTRPRMPPKPD